MKKRRTLSPTQIKALFWLPADTTLARLVKCDGTRRDPRMDTLYALDERGLAESLNWGAWWRITPAGLEARTKASGAYPEQRVTT